MNNKAPVISIIISVANPKRYLSRMLKALAAQHCPHAHMEILLVAARQIDELEAMLKDWQGPACYLIKPVGAGLAAAHNSGATAAAGRILLFLTEQLEPTPQLVQAHVQTHLAQTGQVVIGAYRFAAQGTLDFINMKLRSWWEARFYAMAHPSHRFTYRDLIGGNFSIEADLFNQLGGFNPYFDYGADYELGLRLLKAGVPFVYKAEALGYYHELLNLKASFELATHEGRLYSALASHYPELASLVPVAYFGAPQAVRRRYLPDRLYSLDQLIPGIGDWAATMAGGLLPLLERARFRSQWRVMFRSLMTYWYWRGVAQAKRSHQTSFLSKQGDPTTAPESSAELVLDIRQGLAAVERRLDEQRPASLALYYGLHYLGYVSPQPGAERLRGVHLRPILAGQLAVPLLQALALSQILEGNQGIAPQSRPPLPLETTDAKQLAPHKNH